MRRLLLLGILLLSCRTLRPMAPPPGSGTAPAPAPASAAAEPKLTEDEERLIVNRFAKAARNGTTGMLLKYCVWYESLINRCSGTRWSTKYYLGTPLHAAATGYINEGYETQKEAFKILLYFGADATVSAPFGEPVMSNDTGYRWTDCHTDSVRVFLEDFVKADKWRQWGGSYYADYDGRLARVKELLAILNNPAEWNDGAIKDMAEKAKKQYENKKPARSAFEKSDDDVEHVSYGQRGKDIIARCFTAVACAGMIWYLLGSSKAKKSSRRARS